MSNRVSSLGEVDKAKVGAAFDRAAGTYDEMARFQHQVCDRLLDLLPTLAPSLRRPIRLLDGGCGTGYGAELLHKRWPGAEVTGCDLSPEMLRRTQQRGIQSVGGDLECLPFADNSFDFAWTSLALQWCQPKRAFAELQRVLAPGGVLAFATLGPGTLHEIDFAFSGIDSHRHVLPFVPSSEIGSALESAGFSHSRLIRESWVPRHADFKALLATIRGIGANQIGGERRQTLMGKNAWRTAQARYETLRDEKGLLPTTYQVVFGSAVKQAA